MDDTVPKTKLKDISVVFANKTISKSALSVLWENNRYQGYPVGDTPESVVSALRALADHIEHDSLAGLLDE